MDTYILQQAEKKRKLRALGIILEGGIESNGVDGQYYVQSQSNNGRYLVAVPRVLPPRGKCSCPDGFAKRWGIRCKHILAAELYEHMASLGVRVIHSRRFGQLFARLCPDCGWPGLVPAESIEALDYILREDWKCITCQRMEDEI
jgi:hypothetical protein